MILRVFFVAISFLVLFPDAQAEVIARSDGIEVSLRSDSALCSSNPKFVVTARNASTFANYQEGLTSVLGAARLAIRHGGCARMPEFIEVEGFENGVSIFGGRIGGLYGNFHYAYLKSPDLAFEEPYELVGSINAVLESTNYQAERTPCSYTLSFKVIDRTQSDDLRYSDELIQRLKGHSEDLHNSCLHRRPPGRSIQYTLFNADESLSRKSSINLKDGVFSSQIYPNLVKHKQRLAPLAKLKLSEDQIRIENEQRDEALRYGYVFKNLYYWLELDTGLTKSLFNGWYRPQSDDPINDEFLAVAIASYVLTRDELCSSSFALDTPTVDIVSTTTTYNQYGGTESSNSEVTRVVKIEPRFLDPYLKTEQSFRRSDLNAVASVFTQGAGPGGFLQHQFDGLRYASAFNQRFRKIYSEEGCDSPTMKQFAENIFRYAKKLPTVQAAKLSIPNAIAVTDPTPKTSDAKSFLQKCITGTKYDSKHNKYCLCLRENVLPVLNPEDTRSIDRDFLSGFQAIWRRHEARSTSYTDRFAFEETECSILLR